MATTFIEADKTHPVVRQALRACQMLREADGLLASALAGMDAMKDGDGTQAAHFALLQSECSVVQNGYASANAAAKQLYDEVNSVAGNSSAGIAAAKQLCAYLGD